MYENIDGLIDVNSPSRYKIAIVGESGAGKSWVGLTAPGSIFVADFDDRAESVKEFVRRFKRTDIACKSYLDRNPTQPEAVSKFEADIAMFEYAKSQGKEIPEWYMLDSITFLKTACEHELVKQHPNMSRSIKLGANSIKIPQGYDIINGNRAYLEYIIGRLSELGNVIAIFHEIDETDKATSTASQKSYTGRKTIQPQYLNSLLSVFNDRFRITIGYGGERKLQVEPDSNFLSVTSMKLDASEEPDLAKMIAKHKVAIAR